jgi:hypothetical protein
MDILWAAVGISVIVGFLLYVWAGHLGRVLRSQSLTVRHLADRLRLLEEVENPQFRERIGESVPPPLEQVLTFSFRFSDRFWRETLQLSENDRKFVRSFGSFVGSVKLERWRSHTVATITEVLPDRKTAAWQTRSLEYYAAPSARNGSLTLWELPLSRHTISERPPILQLSLNGDALELFASGRATDIECEGGAAAEPSATFFFRAPLELAELSEFRTADPSAAANGSGKGHTENAVPWQTFYSWEDESRGLEWHLHVRDLSRKSEWERWKILEAPSAPRVRNAH